MKNFARVCSSARTDKSPSVREKNSDNAAEVSYLAAESGNLSGPGCRPGPDLRDIHSMFDCCLPVTSGNLIGESFASTLENHARYPSLRKGRDADLLAIVDCLVEQRIRRIAELLPGFGFDGAGIALYRSAALSAFRAVFPTNRGDLEMSTGRISHYDEGRGFGFIIPDDGGADVFVHANYLVNADFLRKDQKVSFEVVNDDRHGKPRADKVRVI